MEIMYPKEIEQNETSKQILPDNITFRNKETLFNEQGKHERMKMLGRKILFYMGIPQSCIKEEVTVDCNGKRYRLDLLATPTWKGGYTEDSLQIAIECGDNKAEKIEALRNTFPLVLILPYKEFDMENQEIMVLKEIGKGLRENLIHDAKFFNELDRLKKDFTEKENILKEYANSKSKEVKEYIDNNFNKSKEELNEEIEYLKLEVKEYQEQLNYLKNFHSFCKEFGQK